MGTVFAEPPDHCLTCSSVPSCLYIWKRNFRSRKGDMALLSYSFQKYFSTPDANFQLLLRARVSVRRYNSLEEEFIIY
jgi:hypothetical protein